MLLLNKFSLSQWLSRFTLSKFQRRFRKLIVLALFTGLAHWESSAHAVSTGNNAQTFSYQGQLMDSSGVTPLTGVISMTVGIYDSSDTCLLYEETQSQDVTNTEGVFSIEVGSFFPNAKRTANDPGLSMAQVFANTGSLAGFGCTYNPQGGDPRRIRLTLTSTQLGTVTLSPDQYLSATPQALVAETLQGLGPSSFIQVGGNVTQTNLGNLTNNSDASSFSLHHHDSRYLMIGSANNVNLGTATTFTTGSLGIGTSTPTARFEVQTAGPGQIGQTIKGSIGQTNPLFELRDSANALLSYFDPMGRLVLNSAPSGPNDAVNKNYVDNHGVTSFNTRAGAISLTLADVTVASGVSATEFSYLTGVTGSIQGRLNTLQTLLDTKEVAIASGTTSQYYRGDKTFQNLDTSVVAESGVNQYYTNARAQAAINVSGGLLSINTGTISLGIGNIPLMGTGPVSYGITGSTGYFSLVAPSGQLLIGNASGNVVPVAMNGDGTLTSSGTFILSSSVAPGATSGSYSKVSVNSRGIVVAGTGLLPADLAGALTGDVVGSSTGSTVQKIVGMPVAPSGAYSVTGVTGAPAGSYFLGWNGSSGNWEPMPARGPLTCSGGTMIGPAGKAGTFCISPQNAQDDWVNAINSCRAAGAHLCTPTEWITACVSSGAIGSLVSEWVFEPRVAGLAGNMTAGSPCSSGFSFGESATNTNKFYRCCSN